MSIGSQSVLLASTVGNPATRAGQAAVLVSHSPPSARAVRSSYDALLSSVVNDTVPACTQAAVLVAYRTGSIENLNSRAWSFTLDGHTFYAITLGEQGTYVYDQTSGQWAKWQTAGLPGWNMEIGTTWKNRIIACDQANPIIWELDPSSFLDDGFKVQTRKSTGGIPMRGRNFHAHYAFRLTASLGEFDVPATAPLTSPTVQLRFSDDKGKTFTDVGTVTIGELDFEQEIAWLSLGTIGAPGRIFEITDKGAVARIDGADAEVEGFD